MNKKNELQSYCQKHRLELPVYTSERNSEGRWVSVVTFEDVAGQTWKVCGPPCSKKSQSDIAAAEVAMVTSGVMCPVSGSLPTLHPKRDIVKIKREHTLVAPMRRSKMYVLVDYENINALDSLHYQWVRDADDDRAQILKFIGYCHHKAESDEVSHVPPVGGSDAIDHYISAFIGLLVGTGRIDGEEMTIAVLTGDLFAKHLMDFSHGLSWLTIKHVPTESKCVDYLKIKGYRKTDTLIIYAD